MVQDLYAELVKVLAAMSGGVDSALAAALAVEAGHEVTGVHMALMRNRALYREGSRGCCSIEDALDARRVADKLGIPFYTWDLSEQFAELVVADFLNEYAQGRTPNPCIRCNEHVKFNVLANKAKALGFDAIATGHYARLLSPAPSFCAQSQNPGTFAGLTAQNMNVELHRARNFPKDQSYVLAVAGQERLKHCYFPLGDFQTKQEVREEAKKRNLPVSAKPDSYDICFIPDGDTRGFLKQHLGEQKGAIVDIDGKQLGEHDGAYGFTIGQRKGLDLKNPAKDGAPRYVLKTDPATNTVVVGGKQHLVVTSITATDPVWYLPPPSLDKVAPSVEEAPSEPSRNHGPKIQPDAHNTPCRDVKIQVRAHGREVPARLTVLENGAVRFDLIDDALAGIAAGQSVVAYDGTRVVAQATVSQAGTPASAGYSAGERDSY